MSGKFLGPARTLRGWRWNFVPGIVLKNLHFFTAVSCPLLFLRMVHIWRNGHNSSKQRENIQWGVGWAHQFFSFVFCENYILLHFIVPVVAKDISFTVNNILSPSGCWSCLSVFPPSTMSLDLSITIIAFGISSLIRFYKLSLHSSLKFMWPLANLLDFLSTKGWLGTEKWALRSFLS